MPIEVLMKTPMPRVNLLIRLTTADTKFLNDRIEDAVKRGTGVNLVLENMGAAACLISSRERGRQITLNAFTDNITYRVSSPMRGYNGPWSHVEFVMKPEQAKVQLTKFIKGLDGKYSNDTKET